MNHWLDFFSNHGLPRNEIDPDDGWLLERENWPADFKLYLSVTNGCDVESSEELNIRIPIPWNDRQFIHDQISCFYGQRATQNQDERGWLTATDISIPEGTLAVAKFESSSLAVLSLRAKDYGSIYYWDWYMNYPWRGDYFNKRLESVYERFGNELNTIIEIGESHPKYPALNEASNEVLLVKLADSFTEFISMIKPRSD